MKYNRRNLKDGDYVNPILKSYFRVADMLVETFGAICEVVIHDLTTPQSSVVYVANGSVTGRRAGQSFDHLIKQVLLNKNFRNDKVSNYEFDANGKKIKSSSVLIRDGENEVIGMLCLNIDMTFFNDAAIMLNNFLPSDSCMQNSDVENGADEFEEITSIINQLIDNVIGDRDVSEFKKKDNIEIIEFMDKKGVFLVKGAVDKVAERMGVSRVTIYNYLDEIRNG